MGSASCWTKLDMVKMQRAWVLMSPRPRGRHKSLEKTHTHTLWLFCARRTCVSAWRGFSPARWNPHSHQCAKMWILLKSRRLLDFKEQRKNCKLDIHNFFVLCRCLNTFVLHAVLCFFAVFLSVSYMFVCCVWFCVLCLWPDLTLWGGHIHTGQRFQNAVSTKTPLKHFGSCWHLSFGWPECFEWGNSHPQRPLVPHWLDIDWFKQQSHGHWQLPSVADITRTKLAYNLILHWGLDTDSFPQKLIQLG